MDPLTLLVGALMGGALVAAFFLGRRSAQPRSGPASPGPTPAPPPQAPASSTPARSSPTPQSQGAASTRPSATPVAESAAPTPLRPTPAAAEAAADPPASDEPELRVVVYQCPQCGAALELFGGLPASRCAYCDAGIRVERRDRPGARTPARARDWTPWTPPHEATINAYRFGRFDLVLLRQPCHAAPREVLRWVPLGERHAGLIMLRVVAEEREREPSGSPAALEALTEVALARLRERRDPGLALKASLQALSERGEPGLLEGFVALFDAAQSQVLVCNAGCTSAMIHCDVEEARPIDRTRAHVPLAPAALRGKPDVFANQGPFQLAAGDAVLAISAAFGGEGRGWPRGPGSTFRALREAFPAGDPEALALAVKDGFWEERARTPSGCARPPVGDLLVAAVGVRSNLELRGPATVGLPAPRSFHTETFDLACVPSARACCELLPLHSRRSAWLWVEGLAAGDPRLEPLRAGVLAVLDGQTGDNGNPRRAGREGFAAAGIEDPEVRALVAMLDDRYGKLAFWTRGWASACSLPTRAQTHPSLQVFDEGGETWIEPGTRMLFLGAAPVRGQPPLRADGLAQAWPGGKASALYELCRQHEDHAGSAAFLTTVLSAVRTDAPDAELHGVAVVTRSATT